MLLTRSRNKPGRGHAPRSASSLPSARIGRLADVSPGGFPRVTCEGVIVKPVVAVLASPPPGPLEAAVGREVVLVFENGDAARPIVVGWVEAVQPPAARDLRVDGKRMRVTAEQELVLRCGDASITLTADGRVLVRGRGVLTHAKELNRIRGGQVKIN